jgi:O-antigen ligase
MILRPASVIMCAIAMLTVQWHHFAGRTTLLWGFLAIAALILLHLLPLPPGIWQNLPGRALFVEIDNAVGFGPIWRPLTIAPMNGWHTLLALTTPLAVLLLAVQLNRNDLFRLLYVIIGLGALSAITGALQVAGGESGGLYFYNITNKGAAVGLFANRNHAATLLASLLPMLSVFASNDDGTVDQQRLRQMLAAGFAIILIPLIVITGSRSGLGLALLGVVAALLLYRKPTTARVVRRSGRQRKIPPVPILGGLAAFSMLTLTVIVARTQVLGRLFKQSSFEDGRGEYWSVAVDLIAQYFPLGSGAGSFVEAYNIAEPDHLLNASYLNHAHNDWLETAVTFGLPGIALLFAGLYAVGRQAIQLWRNGQNHRPSVRMARMAAVVILLFGLASITDYPMRTPSMMCTGVIALLWLYEWSRPVPAVAKKAKSPNSDGAQ